MRLKKKTFVYNIDYVDNEGYGNIEMEITEPKLSVEEAVEVLEQMKEARGTMIDKFEVRRKWL